MKPYIKDLAKEIEEAIKEAKKTNKPADAQKDLAHFNQPAEQKSFLCGTPLLLEEITGIPANALPPDYLLSKEDKAYLSILLEKLIEAWGFIPDFPERLPKHLRYRHIRRIWNTQQVYLGMGKNNYIEFCDFDELNCPFTNYCDLCDQIKEQEKLYNRLMNKIKK